MLLLRLFMLWTALRTWEGLFSPCMPFWICLLFWERYLIRCHQTSLRAALACLSDGMPCTYNLQGWWMSELVTQLLHATGSKGCEAHTRHA